MTFEWKLFNRLASDFISNHRLTGLEEAYFRTAISRSYYSVFCPARDYLQNHDGAQLPRKNIHKFVREEYQKSPDRIRQAIGENLKRLHGERVRADYEGRERIELNRAIEAHKLAVRIFQKLQQLAP